MLKRLFDFVVALILSVLLLPLMVVIAILIKLNSSGPVFFIQQRVGKNGVDFGIIKFRTMFTGSESKGQLTIGKDLRITGIGHFLRRFKLDELPQLFNVIKGEMSLVGPRPEVKKYVALYTDEQKKVLSVKPGITDMASIRFAGENSLLDGCSDPEKKYITEIMPAKLSMNLEYIEKQNFFYDLTILALTFSKIFLKKDSS